MNKYLFIIGFVLLPWLAHGGVYQWVDDNGHVHFGSVPPQQQHEYKVGEIELRSAAKAPKKELPQEKTSTDDAVSQIKPHPVKVQSEKNDGKPTSEQKGEEASVPKKQPAPKHLPTKFDDRQELKKIIERLREKVQIPRSLKKSPETERKPLLPKKTKISPLTGGKDVKAAAIKSSKLKKETSNEENVSPTSNAEASSKEAIGAEQNLTQMDTEKCGVFTGFVLSYETKVAEECPGAHCSVYQRSLKKFKLKQKRYCESD